MSLSKRIEALEKRTGFSNNREQNQYLQYAQKLKPDISPDAIRRPSDYLDLLKEYLKPLPDQE